MKYDTYIELVPAEEQRFTGGNVVQLGFKRAAAISGFQKTINKWLKALLTEEGSDLTDRTYGTAFPRLLGSNITARRDVQEVIETSVRKATELVKGFQRGVKNIPAEELLDDVLITSIVFSSDNTRVDVTVDITNNAKKRLSYTIPVLR